MTIPLSDARELSDEVLEALRLRALRGCQLGLTETQVAQVLRVARETVCRGGPPSPTRASRPFRNDA